LLKVKYLGGFHVCDSQFRSVKPSGNYARILLAYLCYEGSVIHRDEIAERVFGCSEARDANVGTNIRKAIHVLRKAPAISEVLAMDRDRIGVVPGSVETDLSSFLAAIERFDGDPQNGLSRTLRDLLERDFLPGWPQDWVLIACADHRAATLRALRSRRDILATHGNKAAAIELAKLAVALNADGLEESEKLVRMYVESGQIEAARSAWHAFDEAALESDNPGVLVDNFADNLADVRDQVDPIRPRCAREAFRRSPGEMPFYGNSLVGRAEELLNLVEFMKQTPHGHLSLIGEGGIGKTRLVVEAAKSATRQSQVKPYFIDLSTVRLPERLPGIICRELRISRSDPMASIQATIGQERSVLVLDNVEQLVTMQNADSPPLGQILTRMLQLLPACLIVTTSRIAVGSDAEQPFFVLPLETPTRDQTIEGLLCNFSVRLFCDRASRVDAKFVIDNSNIEPVARFCTAFDGVPLALELAAGQCRRLTPPRLPPFPTRTATYERRAGLGERHNSTHSSLDWSLEVLNEPELENSLRDLAVFRNGFTIDTASQFLGNDATPIIESLELANLVRRVSDSRYRLAEPTRDALIDQIKPSRLSQLQFRLAELVILLASAEQPRLRTIHHTESIARLLEEEDNTRAVLEFLSVADPSRAAGLACRLAPFWEVTGQDIEAKAWLTSLCDSARATAEQRSDMSIALARLWLRSNNPDEAEKILDRAPASNVQTNKIETRRAARAVYVRAHVAYQRAQHETASDLFRSAKTAFELCSDQSGVSDCLINIGDLCFRSADVSKAESTWQEGFWFAEAAGDKRNAAWLLCHMPLASWARLEYEAAEAQLQESVVEANLVGDLHCKGYALLLSAKVAMMQQKFGRAGAFLQDHLTVTGRLGGSSSKEGECWLADLDRRKGDYVRAAKRFGALRDRRDQHGNFSHLGLALIACSRSQYPKAAGLIQPRLAAAVNDNFPRESLLMIDCGILCLAELGDLETASTLLGSVDSFRCDRGLPRDPADAWPYAAALNLTGRGENLDYSPVHLRFLALAVETALAPHAFNQDEATSRTYAS